MWDVQIPQHTFRGYVVAISQGVGPVLDTRGTFHAPDIIRQVLFNVMYDQCVYTSIAFVSAYFSDVTARLHSKFLHLRFCFTTFSHVFTSFYTLYFFPGNLFIFTCYLSTLFIYYLLRFHNSSLVSVLFGSGLPWTWN